MKFLLLLLPLALADKCVLEKDGQKYDLKTLTKSDGDYVVEAEGSKFYLNICKEVQTKDSKGPQNPGKSGFQHDKDGSFIPIGSSDSITIKASQGGLVLKNGDGAKCGGGGSTATRSTLIHITCSNRIESPRYVFDDECTYLFDFPAPIGCRVASSSQPSNSSMSGASVFALILFLGIAVYLVGGIMYRRSQGFRGIDQVPNVDLWKRVFGVFSSWRTDYRTAYSSLGQQERTVMLTDDEQT